MKGFPNQVAKLDKLARGVKTFVHLIDSGSGTWDEAAFGEALVRAGVAGTGHKRRPIDAYLREQRKKPPQGQSHRATARGLRHLYRLLGFIDESTGRLRSTALGRRAAAFAGQRMNARQVEFWRRALRNMTCDGADGQRSHPYVVLLALIGRKPGIAASKCALALEARNDSGDELNRIAALADQPEERIVRTIGVTRSNWENAHKVLPRFAQDLGDILRVGSSFHLADVPVSGAAASVQRRSAAPRQVTPATIARAGTISNFDERSVVVDRAAAADAVRRCRERLRRHNRIVRQLATRLHQAGADLHENPFDICALAGEAAILIEVKSLDGGVIDERQRVRDALSQLLYYEKFVLPSLAPRAAVRKVACFEGVITPDHREWLNQHGIGVIWQTDIRWAGDALAAAFLRKYLEELR